MLDRSGSSDVISGATVQVLDRLIRLEEFLREEDPENRQKIVFEWRDCDHTGKLKDKVGDKDNASTTPAEEKD